MKITLIKGAYVIDPTNNVDAIRDILIQDGYIVEVAQEIDSQPNYLVIDATGLIATPGLIDFHLHGYQYATKLGINVDEFCIQKGVTTAVDAGSSGADTFQGLKRFIMDPSKTRLKAFLHIASHGLASAGCASLETGGECDSLNQLSKSKCIECIKENEDSIIGVKVRLSASVCNDGKNEQEAFKRALDVTKTLGKALMVHHAISTVPIHVDRDNDDDQKLLGCPESLRAGDIYTHAYHSYIIKEGQVHPTFIEARKRGVLFDVGHGMGGFSWENAEICAKSEFWPDMISTDLHTFSCDGPAYDLTTVMSKFLHLGMPLSKIIEAVTITPAKTMNMNDQIGCLSVGMVADITLLQLNDCDINMEDCHSETRRLKKIFKPIQVWRAGENIQLK